MTSKRIYFIVEWTIHEGNLDSFKRLAEIAVGLVNKNEPDTDSYQWYLNEEGTRCILLECFQDSAAMLYHIGIEELRQVVAQIEKLARRTRFEVYGNLNSEAKRALARFRTSNFSTMTGLNRSYAAG